MIVRPLGAADLAAWREIRLEALGAHPAAYRTTRAEEAARPDAAVAERLATGTLHGLWDGEALAGTAGLAPDPRCAHRGRITSVYVRPRWRGTGAADRLLREMFAAGRAAGLLEAELDVGAGNARAIRLYERLGFAGTGAAPSDGDGLESLRYVRRLDGPA